MIASARKDVSLTLVYSHSFLPPLLLHLGFHMHTKAALSLKSLPRISQQPSIIRLLYILLYQFHVRPHLLMCRLWIQDYVKVDVHP